MNKEKAETLLENYQELSELYSNIRKELERTRKVLEVAKEGLKEIQDKGEYVNPIELAESYLDEITALEQKD